MKAEREKRQLDIENSFEMEIIGSYTLNFLTYLHNIYLNQTDDDFKFPYLSKQLLFKEDFEEQFKELWDEVTQAIYKDGETADNKYFYDERELFHKRLLEKDIENIMIFHEVHAAFETWWDSFVGRFSLERSVDAEAQKLYGDLTNAFVESNKVPQKRLRIHLVYDACELTDTTVYSYFVIVPIQEFSIQWADLVPKIQESLGE